MKKQNTWTTEITSTRVISVKTPEAMTKRQFRKFVKENFGKDNALDGVLSLWFNLDLETESKGEKNTRIKIRKGI